MLKIDQIIIDNFCQHEHRELDFPAGLIGVFGRNGVGKSNIANAIYSAFTGNFNRHAEGAAGCIRQGTENAYIEVRGMLADQKFRLRRDLFPSRIKHTLWLNGQRYSDKARDIELWITETSGLTPQMMAEFVFIGQQDLYAFLDANDAERSKKFSALCNTRIYERLRNEYGEMLKIDRAKSEAASDVSIDLLKQNIAGIQSNLKDLRKIANEIQADLTERPANKEELQTLIKRQQETVKLINDYETKLKACDTVLKDIQKQKEQTDRAVSEEAAAKKSWKEYQDSLRDLLQGMDYNTFLAELKERLAAEQKRENLTQQIIKIEQEERELPDLNLPPQSVWEDTNSQLTQIQSEITETESQMESRQAIIDVMNKLADRNSDVINAESACPLCGAGPEHWEVNLADLKTQHEKDKSNIAVLRAELNDTKKQIKQLSDAAAAYRETETKRQTLLKQIKNLEISLAELPKRTKPLQTLPALKESIDKTTNLVTDYKLAKTKAQSAEQAASREKDLLLQKQTDYDTAQNDLQELAKTLIGDYQSPESRDVQREKADRVIADAEAGIRQIDDLLHEQAENNGSIREAERQLTEAERKLKEQESLIADSGKIKQWFEYGDKAITWFKKDGLPRLIHRSVLQQLSTIINTELELYDKPFSIEVNDDLTFTASFADGRRVNSRTLSGGQKAMFALSFLSAINRTFLQDIGIMIWDEPTDGLDAINTDFLYDVLERKKKLLHQRGQQLVIITFDEGMIPVFDAVYRIESPQKQTSQQQ